MIRSLIASTLGAAVILGVAAFFLAVTPVHACEVMVASHYGIESGSRTANGERFTGRDMTAAHKTLPFGTRLKVSYGGKSVVVRVNDRGPWIKGRDLDLSTAAARKLGLTKAGVGRVKACRMT